MRKIGIITHYNVHNYGAVLQLYGLKKVLENMGYNAKALQYHKNYDFINPNIEAKYRISIRSIPIYINYLLKKGIRRTVYNIRKKKMLFFFSKRAGLLGEYYSQAKDLYAIVIGSDEIFSIEAGPNPWFWGIGVACDKAISYAASFGPTDLHAIENHKCVEFVTAGLNRIQHLSVRDRNSYELVRCLTSRDAIITCDPVILYGFKKEFIRESRRKPGTKYLIVYSYDRNFNERKDIDTVRKFAKKNDMKVWSVGYFHKWCDRNIMCSPIEMLDYFNNAEMVITDTFHGSVISIITNTQLMVRLTTKNQKVEFLLSQYGMNDRNTSEIADIDELYRKKIDYNKVNKVIEEERLKSFEYLQKSLVK